MMNELCLIFALGLGVSLLIVTAYRQGIKDGRALKNEIPLEKMFDIPKAETVEETDETEKAINEFMEKGGMV